MGNEYSQSRNDDDTDSEEDLYRNDPESDDGSDFSNDSGREYKRQQREAKIQELEAKRREYSPSRKQAKEEMKYCNSEDDSDTSYYDEYKDCSFTDKRLSMKIHCDWKIHGFADPDVHDEEDFFLISKLYAAGTCNQFQFFFIMEKLVVDGDIHWGVYANVISNTGSEATVQFKSFVVNHKYECTFINNSKDAPFPSKPGYRFLGSINKARFIDDDYTQCSYMGEDGDGSVLFRFKIEVTYDTCQISNDLERLFGEKRENDVTLIVKGKEFKANKNLLAERSPTLAKLFEKEKTNKLKIDDIEPDVMKQLLIFIYTNKVPKLFSLTNHLIAAADNYNVKDLQVMCKKIKAARCLNPQL